MDVKSYFEKINDESQKIFFKTVESYTEELGKCHHISACIFEFSECLFDNNEKDILKTVSSQIESATLNLTLGLYRQSFSSLRLAFEMALATIHFSTDKLEHFEWLKGKGDIKWSKLIDNENGILSVRFSNAFFSDLTPFVSEFNERAAKVYRTLSEFVHGNSETWNKSGMQLSLNEELIKHFFALILEVSEIILFALSCRYLKSISEESRETMEFLSSQLSHIQPIRVIMGGPN